MFGWFLYRRAATEAAAIAPLAAAPPVGARETVAVLCRTVRVYFEAVNDNGNQTSFLVDDAALNVTQ